MMEISIELTKKSLLALWEEGGGATNTGSATIIAGLNGERLTPVYVRRSGSLSCGQHALFIVRTGCRVIMASHWRQDFTIKVYRITSIDLENKTAQLEQLHEFSRGEWDKDPSPDLEDAIEAAKDKATCYHCRSPHYAA